MTVPQRRNARGRRRTKRTFASLQTRRTRSETGGSDPFCGYEPGRPRAPPGPEVERGSAARGSWRQNVARQSTQDFAWVAFGSSTSRRQRRQLARRTSLTCENFETIVASLRI